MSSVYLSYLFSVFRRRYANVGLAISTVADVVIVLPLSKLLGATGIAYAVSIAVSLSVLFWAFKSFKVSKESLLTVLTLLFAFVLSVVGFLI